jgi:LPS sulfotransferase NodH
MAREAMTENGVTSVKLFLPYLSHLMHRARAEFGADFDENGLIEECFPNPRYIFLRRRDRIRQAISFMRAMNTTEFERKTAYPVASTECYAGSTDGNLGGFLHDADDRIRHAAPGADPEPAMEKISSYVEAFTSQELQWRSFFKRNQVTAHEIVYEDLAADYQTTVLGALKFLGISPPPGLRLPPPRTVRQSDDATEKMAARYDEYKVRVQAEAADQSVTGTGSNHSGSFA